MIANTINAQEEQNGLMSRGSINKCGVNNTLCRDKHA